MVDNLRGFLEFIAVNGRVMSKSGDIDNIIISKSKDEFFCPKCGDNRTCEVEEITGRSTFIRRNFENNVKPTTLPCLFKASCLQCGSEALLILYKGPQALELVTLHSNYGGCITPNTPEEIKYYIDQAYRARSVGAISAAMAMYRSALEWLLYNQGFENGMLGKKIKDLQEARDKNSLETKKWVNEIDLEFLKAIKDIGNGAIHTNDGDITKQTAIDKTLIVIVDIVFAELLDKIYEQPIRSKANLSKLQNVAGALK